VDDVLDILLAGASLVLIALLVAAPFAVPIFDLIQRLRRRSLLHRIRQNTCKYCGYDLRENTHRCAECGGFIASTPERVDALLHVSDHSEPGEANDDADAAVQAAGDPEPTGTTPSAGSPPSPG
jgi:hypothetical protein